MIMKNVMGHSLLVKCFTAARVGLHIDSTAQCTFIVFAVIEYCIVRLKIAALFCIVATYWSRANGLYEVISYQSLIHL